MRLRHRQSLQHQRWIAKKLPTHCKRLFWLAAVFGEFKAYLNMCEVCIKWYLDILAATRRALIISLLALEQLAMQSPWKLPSIQQRFLMVSCCISSSQWRMTLHSLTDKVLIAALNIVAQLNKSKAFTHDIVTRIDSFTAFYAAEDYHQDFLIHNPNYPYIVANDLPKIENLKRFFPNIYLKQPVMLSSTL
jgi:hypothetical protein